MEPLPTFGATHADSLPHAYRCFVADRGPAGRGARAALAGRRRQGGRVAHPQSARPRRSTRRAEEQGRRRLFHFASFPCSDSLSAAPLSLVYRTFRPFVCVYCASAMRFRVTSRAPRFDRAACPSGRRDRVHPHPSQRTTTEARSRTRSQRPHSRARRNAPSQRGYSSLNSITVPPGDVSK